MVITFQVLLLVALTVGVFGSLSQDKHKQQGFLGLTFASMVGFIAAGWIL